MKTEFFTTAGSCSRCAVCVCEVCDRGCCAACFCELLCLPRSRVSALTDPKTCGMSTLGSPCCFASPPCSVLAFLRKRAVVTFVTRKAADEQTNKKSFWRALRSTCSVASCQVVRHRQGPWLRKESLCSRSRALPRTFLAHVHAFAWSFQHSACEGFHRV